MNWYRATIDHGPGHQSRTVWYRYSTPDAIREEIDDMDYSWPIASIKRVKKLPSDVKTRLIQNQKYAIKRARDMLKQLELV